MKKLLPFLFVILLLLAACAPAPVEEEVAPAEEEEAAPAEEEEAAPAEEEEAAPAEEEAALAEEYPLRVTFSWPTFIDPAIGNDFSATASLVNLYDTLIFPNLEGGYDPWVAESWNVSDDGMTWTFHLREGVLFHDGSELLASVIFDPSTYSRLEMVITNHHPICGFQPKCQVKRLKPFVTKQIDHMQLIEPLKQLAHKLASYPFPPIFRQDL